MKKYKMSKELSVAIKDLSVYKIHPGNIVKDCTAFLKQCEAEQNKLAAQVMECVNKELLGKYFITVDKSAKSKPINLWHFEKINLKWHNSLEIIGSHVEVLNQDDRNFFYLLARTESNMCVLFDSINKLNLQEITKAEYTAKLKEFQKRAYEYLKG